MTPDDVSATPIFDELLREMAKRTDPTTPGPPPPDHPIPSPAPASTPSPSAGPPAADPRAGRGRRHRAE
jgi:hypothetical protein